MWLVRSKVWSEVLKFIFKGTRCQIVLVRGEM